MATISDVITKINAANTLLKNNLTAKGVSVPDGATTYVMAGIVGDIQSGNKTEKAEYSNFGADLITGTITVSAELGE